jgi:hypothetical protein
MNFAAACKFVCNEGFRHSFNVSTTIIIIDVRWQYSFGGIIETQFYSTVVRHGLQMHFMAGVMETKNLFQCVSSFHLFSCVGTT